MEQNEDSFRHSGQNARLWRYPSSLFFFCWSFLLYDVERFTFVGLSLQRSMRSKAISKPGFSSLVLKLASSEGGGIQEGDRVEAVFDDGDLRNWYPGGGMER